MYDSSKRATGEQPRCSSLKLSIALLIVQTEVRPPTSSEVTPQSGWTNQGGWYWTHCCGVLPQCIPLEEKEVAVGRGAVMVILLLAFRGRHR